MILVISPYSISEKYRNEVELLFGKSLETRNLSELRHAGIFGMVKYLLSVKCETIVVVLEDGSARGLLSLMTLIGSIPRAQCRMVFDEKGNTSKFNRIDGFLAGFSMIFTSISALVATYIFKVQVNILSKEIRNENLNKNGHGVFYLNANLWFGIQAGGSIGHISGVVNGMLKNNLSVSFASVGGRLMVRSDADFIQINPPKVVSIPFETTYYLFNSNVNRQCSGVVEKQQPKFIYQRMSIANVSGVQLSRKFNIPLVIEYNGSEVWVSKHWGKPLRYHNIAETAEECCLKHAHMVVTVSDVLGRDLEQRGVHPDRILVYPNCIDPKVFDFDKFSDAELLELRSKYGIPNDAVVVTFVGTFGQWHGVEVLAEAIKRLLNEKPGQVISENIYFLLVGDGIKMPDVKSILSEIEDSTRIILTGLVRQEEAPLYLAASDILLSPHVQNNDGSEFFGSPTKLFEYLAMGKAILASDLAQIGDVLKPDMKLESNYALDESKDAVALLAEPSNVDHLITGILKLAENATLRSELGKNAKNLALKKYTWDHHVNAIISRLESLGLLESSPSLE